MTQRLCRGRPASLTGQRAGGSPGVGTFCMASVGGMPQRGGCFISVTSQGRVPSAGLAEACRREARERRSVTRLRNASSNKGVSESCGQGGTVCFHVGATTVDNGAEEEPEARQARGGGVTWKPGSTAVGRGGGRVCATRTGQGEGGTGGRGGRGLRALGAQGENRGWKAADQHCKSHVTWPVPVASVTRASAPQRHSTDLACFV